MTDRTLLSDDPEPADLDGYGPIPAPMVRDWLADDRAAKLPDEAKVWLRRLYTDPGSGNLVAMESARRCFEGNLRRFLMARDRRCRTPWCDAPIRHADHPLPVAKGGKTTADNSQGLCEACNYAKEAPGWNTDITVDGTVETTTPTGHRYQTRPPPGIGPSG